MYTSVFFFVPKARPFISHSLKDDVMALTLCELLHYLHTFVSSRICYDFRAVKTDELTKARLNKANKACFLHMNSENFLLWSKLFIYLAGLLPFSPVLFRKDWIIVWTLTALLEYWFKIMLSWTFHVAHVEYLAPERVSNFKMIAIQPIIITHQPDFLFLFIPKWMCHKTSPLSDLSSLFQTSELHQNFSQMNKEMMLLGRNTFLNGLVWVYISIYS